MIFFRYQQARTQILPLYCFIVTFLRLVLATTLYIVKIYVNMSGYDI